MWKRSTWNWVIRSKHPERLLRSDTLYGVHRQERWVSFITRSKPARVTHSRALSNSEAPRPLLIHLPIGRRRIFLLLTETPPHCITESPCPPFTPSLPRKILVFDTSRKRGKRYPRISGADRGRNILSSNFSLYLRKNPADHLHDNLILIAYNQSITGYN
jgi:hypothetical protein